MSYKRIRLLLAYDPSGGLCAGVVPRMKEMLEHRAFDVDTYEIGNPAPDLEPYKGVVLGCAVRGLGLRGDVPTQALLDFVSAAEGLDEKKVALFTVCTALPGKMLLRLREAVEARGSTVVVMHAYNRFRPEDAEEVLPAECMVRIR